MKSSFIFVCIAIIAMMAIFTQPILAAKGSCMGCTIVVTVLNQIAYKNNLKIDAAAQLWCQALSQNQKWVNDLCYEALKALAPTIQSDFDNQIIPDQTCAKLTMCSGDDLKCSLWTKKTSSPIEEAATIEAANFETSPADIEQFITQFSTEGESIFSFVAQSLVSWSSEKAVKPLEDYAAILKHKPMEETQYGETKWYHRAWVDLDKDMYSTVPYGRGYNWGGRDCNDLDPTIYPGRKTNSKNDPNIDHNCNGIFGVDPVTKVPYETQWCSMKQYNILALGDSATAHFSLPPCWLSGACIKNNTYTGMLDIVMNEMDFPHCSSVTGYNSTACPSLFTSLAPFQSIYNAARQRNPCIHRAYHNIGVNGARSTSMAPGPNKDGIITAFTPDPDNDHPYAVFLSLIGNDVCNKNSDTSSMTSETDYHDAMLDSLNYLDNVLPPESNVWIGSLVRGSALYDILGQEQHPIGPIKYSAFYDYLNCFNTSPCAGWLNTDANIRNATDIHAAKLNTVAKSIINNYKFKNFRLRYLDTWRYIDETIATFKKSRLPLSRVIEATDGFHPSTTTQSILAQAFLDDITFAKDVGGEIIAYNPHRDDIIAKFGEKLNGY